MRALIRAPDACRLVHRAVPTTERPDQVLVRVDLAGICRTDLSVAAGRLPVARPVVLGHELVGTVLEAAPSTGLRPGQRVTADPLLPCGGCRGCTTHAACLTPLMLGRDVDGAFAEQLSLPASALYPVPDLLDPRLAAFTEPVAACMAVLDAGVSPDQRGLVYGQGRIAELTLRILRAGGFERVEVGLAEALPDGALDFAIETHPTPVALARLVTVLRPGGTLVLKSRPPAPVPVDLWAVVRRELRLVGAHYGDFPRAVRWLADGRLRVDDLLGPVHALDDWERVFSRLEHDESQKHFLAPGLTGAAGAGAA